MTGEVAQALAEFVNVLHYGQQAKDLPPGWDGWLMWMGRVEAAADDYAHARTIAGQLRALEESERVLSMNQPGSVQWAEEYQEFRVRIERGELVEEPQEKEQTMSDSKEGHC